MFRIKNFRVSEHHMLSFVFWDHKKINNLQVLVTSDDDRLSDTRVKSSECVLFAHVYVDKIYYNVRVAYY